MANLIETLTNAKSIEVNGRVAEILPVENPNAEPCIVLRHPVYGDNPDAFMTFAEQDVEVSEEGKLNALGTMIPTGDELHEIEITIHV